jgi:hypothetical protein
MESLKLGAATGRHYRKIKRRTENGHCKRVLHSGIAPGKFNRALQYGADTVHRAVLVGWSLAIATAHCNLVPPLQLGNATWLCHRAL